MILPIIRGPLKGKRWIVGAAAGDGKGLSIIINQSEPEQLKYAAGLLQDDFICFDIGANVGFYTLLFSLKAREVYSFEPLPRNLMYLAQMIRINSLSNVRIIPCAVSDASGIRRFSDEKRHSLGHLSQNGTIPVLTTTCDQFVSETGISPQLLKIDVEGSEFSVLKGAHSLLQSAHPSILLSTHSNELRESCLSYLNTLGYKTIINLNSPDINHCSEFAIRY